MDIHFKQWILLILTCFSNLVREVYGATDCVYTTAGLQYSGTVATTGANNPCSFWEFVIPSGEDYQFIDGSSGAANNYCRNPTNRNNQDAAVGAKPFCYINDNPNTPEDCADLPTCTGVEPPMPTVQACGGVLTATSSSQTFESGNFPENYMDNQDCTWTISGNGQSVKLTFEAFSTELNYDFVLVSNGLTLLATYTGEQFNGGPDNGGPGSTELVTTGDNSMTVQFTSDVSGTSTGFQATYRLNDGSTEPPPETCGGSLSATTSDQELSLPSTAGENYENDLDCIWTITAPSADYVIKTTITEIDVEANTDIIPNGCYDYVALYDGPGITSDVLKKACGILIEGVIPLSTTDVVTVQFSSDSSATRTGFRLTYVATMFQCGTALSPTKLTATTTVQSIIVDQQTYVINLNCVWEITAPDGSTINIQVKNVDIELGDNGCQWDSLQLENGDVPFQQSPICGVTELITEESTGPSVTATFISDDSETKTGFTLTYVISGDFTEAPMTSTEAPMTSPEDPTTAGTPPDVTTVTGQTDAPTETVGPLETMEPVSTAPESNETAQSVCQKITVGGSSLNPGYMADYTYQGELNGYPYYKQTTCEIYIFFQESTQMWVMYRKTDDTKGHIYSSNSTMVAKSPLEVSSWMEFQGVPVVTWVDASSLTLSCQSSTCPPTS